LPKACQALERWAAVAELKTGEPLFRAVDQCQFISTERLTELIVKSRVKALVKQRGRSEAEAKEVIELISGHSLRAGYANLCSGAQHAGLSDTEPRGDPRTAAII
jgi:hypothetical protein